MKSINQLLTEAVSTDNSYKYRRSNKYGFYSDMAKYIGVIMDQLKTISGSAVLINGLGYTGESAYNHSKIGQKFSTGHVVGLAVEEAFVNALKHFINGYDGEDDDIADVMDIIGKQGMDVQEEMKLNIEPDNHIVSDFSIDYAGSTYKMQIKAINKKNYKKGINDLPRKGNQMCICIVYSGTSDIQIDEIHLYVPDADGTFNSIAKTKLGKSRLKLDPNNAFIVIK